jgi:hypothetical protein
MLLTTQLRPPKEIPDLIAGRYTWEDYHPVGNWLARRIVEPWDQRIAFHKDSLPALFRPLPNGTPTTVTFQADSGKSLLEPTLIYRRQGKEPVAVTISVDNRVAFSGTLDASLGEIRLVAIPAGVHSVTVSAPNDVRFAINYTGPSPDSSVMRLANRFRGAELVFDYEKAVAEEEILGMRFYAASPGENQATIRVFCDAARTKKGGGWTSWTFPERRYTIRLDGADQVQALGTDGRPLLSGEPLYIPFGDDLPPGRYTIRVVTEKPVEGYITLSRTTPGIAAKRVIQKEGEVWAIEIAE